MNRTSSGTCRTRDWVGRKPLQQQLAFFKGQSPWLLDRTRSHPVCIAFGREVELSRNHSRHEAFVSRANASLTPGAGAASSSNGGALHQGPDRGLVLLADDQVPFPISGHCAVLNLGGALAHYSLLAQRGLTQGHPVFTVSSSLPEPRTYLNFQPYRMQQSQLPSHCDKEFRATSTRRVRTTPRPVTGHNEFAPGIRHTHAAPSLDQGSANQEERMNAEVIRCGVVHRGLDELVRRQRRQRHRQDFPGVLRTAEEPRSTKGAVLRLQVELGHALGVEPRAQDQADLVECHQALLRVGRCRGGSGVSRSCQAGCATRPNSPGVCGHRGKRRPLIVYSRM